MKRVMKAGVALAAALLLGATMTAQADIGHDRIVSDNPVDNVPIIDDGGGVFGVATVDGTTVVGGSFNTITQRNGTAFSRNNIAAFDSNGNVSTTFRPSLSGRVWDIIPSGDGHTVFIGGQFTRVNGAGRTSRVARVDVNTGQVVSTFRSPGFDNIVTDLQLANGRLYVGGYFKNAGGQPHVGLVALDPTTGALTNHMNQITFADVFRNSSTATIPSGNRGVGVERFSITPDGSRLVAIGNFRTVSGQSRVQVAVINTSGAQATLADWSTTRFSSNCSSNFPTYTLGVDTSPDGSYFVVGTGGAFNGGVQSGTLCDSVSRWDIGATGSNQQPTWVDYMGGDTATAVDVTGAAVYVGGHFRWANNPYAGDSVGPGTIKRAGLAVFDTRNGLPFSFKAARSPLRWGVGRFVSVTSGLWIAHDGSRVGGETTGRVAFLPAATGKTLPNDNTGSLPGDVYVAGRTPELTSPNPVLYRVNAGGPSLAGTDGLGSWTADEDASSPLRTSGSNAALWTQTFDTTSSVPSTTPRAVFSTERWDSAGGDPMQWDLPVPAGTPIQVRLYFANGYDGTSQPGQRTFDVDLDNTRVLNNYDIVADTGATSRGTMKSFDVTSDGNVDIDFSHEVENPLINAIEVVRTDVGTPGTTNDDSLVRTAMTPDSAGTSVEINNGGYDWSSARAAFMVDKTLYTAWNDGTMTWSPANNNGTIGRARTVGLQGLTAFESELQNMGAMWFDRDTGRMYFTLRGQSNLRYRYFTPESNVIGAVPMTASDTGTGIDWGNVTGGFLANGRLYYSSTDGRLRSVQWDGGPVAGTITVVSGPGVDSKDWSSGALYLFAP